MNRFKNILAVCTDAVGCDDVIEQASALALANEARLTLISFGSADPSWREEQTKRLRRFASTIEHAGVREVETRLVGGSPSESIVREVTKNWHDLVIMSREIGDTWSGALFGRTTRKMMKNCPCPVWFLRPGQSVPFKRVLAVVDPCLDGNEDRDLNIKILEIALSLATTHGAALHIVHAWEVDGKDYDTVRSEMRPKNREKLLRKHSDKRQSAISSLLDSIKDDDLDYEIHLPRATPLRAYSDTASDLSIDVMVMSAGDMSNLSLLMGGTLANALLDSVSCSLLTITPDAVAKPVLFDSDTAFDAGREAAV